MIHDFNIQKCIYIDKLDDNTPSRSEEVCKKGGTGINTLKFSKKIDLANLKSDCNKLDVNKLKTIPSVWNNLKSKVDKLNVDKLETNPVDLKKLSDVFDKDVVKKSE